MSSTTCNLPISSVCAEEVAQDVESATNPAEQSPPSLLNRSFVFPMAPPSGFLATESVANMSPTGQFPPLRKPAEAQLKFPMPPSPARSGHRRGGTVLDGGDTRMSPIIPSSPRFPEPPESQPSNSAMPAAPSPSGRRAAHVRSTSAAIDGGAAAFRLQSPAHSTRNVSRSQGIHGPMASPYGNAASYSRSPPPLRGAPSELASGGSGPTSPQNFGCLASDEELEARAFELLDKDMTVVLSPDPGATSSLPPTPTLPSSDTWARPALSSDMEPSYLIDLDSAFKPLGQSTGGNARRMVRSPGWTAPRHHRRTESAPDFPAGSEWRRSSMTRWTGSAMADVSEEAEEDEHAARGGTGGVDGLQQPSFTVAPSLGATDGRPTEAADEAVDTAEVTNDTSAAEQSGPAEAGQSTTTLDGLGVSKFSSSSSEESKAKKAGVVDKAKTSVARARSRASQWSRRRFSRGLVARSGSEGAIGGSLPPTPGHPHDVPTPLSPSFVSPSVPPSPSAASAWTMDPAPPTAVSFDDVPSLTRSSSTRTSAVYSYAAASSSRPISRDDAGAGAMGHRPISSSNSAAATRRSSLASAPSFRTAPSIAPRRLSPLVPTSQAEQTARPEEGNAGGRGRLLRGLTRLARLWGL